MPTNDPPAPLKPAGSRPPSTAALSLALATTLAVVLVGRIPIDARWAADLSNAAHGPAFAVVTLILLALLRRRVPARPVRVLRDYALAISGSVALGAVIEILQFLTARDASFADLWRDALGAFAAAGFCAAFDPHLRVLRRPRTVRACGLTVGLACTMLLITPLAMTAAAYLQRNQRFPVLVDFNAPVSAYFTGAYGDVIVGRRALPTAMRRDDGVVVGLHARATSDKWWSLAVWEPIRDWRSYDRVSVELANPTREKLSIRVRIRAGRSASDRQRGVLGTIEIPPETRGTATLRLTGPGRDRAVPPVDLADVHALVLVRGAGSRAREFYVLRIWLE